MATVRGGDRVAAYLDRIGRSITGEPHVKVGFLSGATYPDGTSVALVAAVNEFGAPSRGQPPRPFFRIMLAEKRATWPDAIANLMRANNNDVPKVLDLAGQAIAGQLRASIVAFDSPALAASTIARKGSAKPLVDTGHMLNSIDHEVVV